LEIKKINKEMEKILKYNEYKLNEDGEGGGAAFSGGGDAGGGVAFATLNGNGMGNIVTAQVGTQTGSVWQNGSGTKGSGDSAAYNTSKSKFDFIKKKKGKKDKKESPKPIMKFADFIVGPNS
jgi:hypothetical protein